MRTLLFAALTTGALLSSLEAQQPASPTAPPPLPSGPLLNPAPDYAQWSVITKLSSAASAEGGKPAGGKPEGKPPERRTVVTKTGDIRKQEQVDEAGVRSETWTFGGYTVTLRQGSPEPAVTMGGKAKATSAKDDFPDFEWISRKNYTGIQKVLGKDCIVFRGKTGVGADEPSLPAVATVDLEARLPVSLAVNNEESSVYQFSPNPPQEMLVPPPSVQQAVNAWKTHLQELARPVPRPF